MDGLGNVVRTGLDLLPVRLRCAGAGFSVKDREIGKEGLVRPSGSRQLPVAASLESRRGATFAVLEPPKDS